MAVRRPWLLGACALLCALGLLDHHHLVAAETSAAPDMVRLPAVDVPISVYLSSESKQRYSALLATTTDSFSLMLDRAKAVYPVTIESATFGGVKADVVTPKNGVS